MTRQREVQKSDQFEDAVSSQASVESRRAIAERVDRFAALAKSLASSSEFRNPSDHDKDGARYMDRDREQGGQMALYDHITTWLQSESGPPVPLLDWRKLPKSVAVWQLARGLPIRSPGGALLAKGRRRLVADTLSSNPEIASIAELDSRGRVVFLAPYAVQLTLETFNLRPTVGPLQSGAEARALFLRVPSGGGVPAALSIVVPFERATGIYYLLLTLGPRVPTVRELPGGSPSFGVFDGQGEILMYAGDPAALLAASAGRAPAGGERASHSSVLIGGLDYSLVTLTPNSPVRAAIEVGFLATIATYILAFALMLLIVRRVLLWLTREQWKRNHLRAQTERAAQDLAHDFRKGLLMLRTTKDSISHKLDSLDLQRLEGAIIDITGYADHLSRSLVADTFALPEVPGGAVSAQVEATAYVRGILENVIEQHAAMLKRSIPLAVSDDPAGDEPFGGIGATDLTRIVSNLLDNSIDACHAAGTDEVSVAIQASGRDIRIRVADNGCGVEVARQRELFVGGFTTKGKERGKGLSSCQKLARKWDGDLTLLASIPGEGTQMELRVPRRPTPPWFVNKVTLKAGSVLVVVDDEGPVCDYWEKRFKERFEGISLPTGLCPRLVLVRRADDPRMRGELLSVGTDFFVDYKFDGEDVTGIGLIEELHLESRAVLVTNHFERANVLAAVQRLGIRLLPKNYMFSIKFPIEIGGLLSVSSLSLPRMPADSAPPSTPSQLGTGSTSASSPSPHLRGCSLRSRAEFLILSFCTTTGAPSASRRSLSGWRPRATPRGSSCLRVNESKQLSWSNASDPGLPTIGSGTQ